MTNAFPTLRSSDLSQIRLRPGGVESEKLQRPGLREGTELAPDVHRCIRQRAPSCRCAGDANIAHDRSCTGSAVQLPRWGTFGHRRPVFVREEHQALQPNGTPGFSGGLWSLSWAYGEYSGWWPFLETRTS